MRLFLLPTDGLLISFRLSASAESAESGAPTPSSSCCSSATLSCFKPRALYKNRARLLGPAAAFLAASFRPLADRLCASEALLLRRAALASLGARSPVPRASETDTCALLGLTGHSPPRRICSDASSGVSSRCLPESASWLPNRTAFCEDLTLNNSTVVDCMLFLVMNF